MAKAVKKKVAKKRVAKKKVAKKYQMSRYNATTRKAYPRTAKKKVSVNPSAFTKYLIEADTNPVSYFKVYKFGANNKIQQIVFETDKDKAWFALRPKEAKPTVDILKHFGVKHKLTIRRYVEKKK